MKKQIILIAIAVTLGMSHSAMAWSWGAGAADLGASVSTSLTDWILGPVSKTPEPPQKIPAPAPPKQKKVQPATPILETLKKQLEEAKKIRNAINGDAKSNTTQADYSSFFLKNPELIYYKNSNSTLSKSLPNILQEEEIPISIRKSRDFIGRRIQYATAIDKAVSLQTFQENENRFKQISELVEKINTTTDLKSIAELQARIKGLLAMIQNEATKLQMVAYSRNAEQALINQQKQTRNMKILNSENKEMPIIRSIR
ncbi:type IV secretion system protein [Bartonella acomydis]|uniref:TrwJ1 protein n=1 Tax=Bartonella acomydis TaxID=686234 RepID=A0ABP9MFY8_9HYPH